MSLLGLGCATKTKRVSEPFKLPDVRLTVNGAHRSVICLRPCEVLLTARLGDEAPEEVLRHRAVSWDFGDGSWATSDRYGEGSVRYVLTRWHRYRAYGTFTPSVRLFGMSGDVVGYDSARIQIGSPE